MMRRLILLFFFLIISSCSTLETTSYDSHFGRAPANTVIKSCKQAIYLITHNSKRAFYKGIGKFKSRANELYKASENGKSLYDFSTQLHLGKEFGISFEQFQELFQIERIKKHIDIEKLNLESLYHDIYISRSLSLEDTYKFLTLEVKAALNPKEVKDNQSLNTYLTSLKLMALDQEEVFSEIQKLPLFNELKGKKRNFKNIINYLSSSDP